MEIDYKKLSAGLDELTGRDYADAEKQLRLLGEATGDITFNKTFSAIIAAKILKVPVDDIQDLPIRDYVAVTTMVNNFLLETLAKQIQ